MSLDQHGKLPAGDGTRPPKPRQCLAFQCERMAPAGRPFCEEHEDRRTKCASTLTEAETLVLLAMPSWHEDLIPYARDQARDIGMPVEQWRRIVQRFIAQGLATYGPLFREDDDTLRGSSYWLTEAGVALRDAIEAETQ